MVSFISSFFVCFAVLVGSWNLKWFPSGRAEHRAKPEVEARTIADAGDVVRRGVGTEKGVILFFQELRDGAACSNLTVSTGLTNLHTAVVSAFREYDRRLGWQQCGIVTDLPVLDARWSYWKHPKRVYPPRGYAYALVDAGKDGLVACYCVHLKSDYGVKTPADAEKNAEKRRVCAEQLVAEAKHVKGPDGKKVCRVVIAGDFNADRFEKDGVDVRTFSTLTDAGFADGWEGAALAARGTHPGKGRWPDSTLDYVFHFGWTRVVSRALSPSVPLSDHRMVWMHLE